MKEFLVFNILMAVWIMIDEVDVYSENEQFVKDAPEQ
jgi:hypothetical protein